MLLIARNQDGVTRAYAKVDGWPIAELIDLLREWSNADRKRTVEIVATLAEAETPKPQAAAVR